MSSLYEEEVNRFWIHCYVETWSITGFLWVYNKYGFYFFLLSILLFTILQLTQFSPCQLPPFHPSCPPLSMSIDHVYMFDYRRKGT